MKFPLYKHSLSGKLTLLFVLVTVLLVILSAILMGSRFKDNFENHLRPHLDKYLEYIRTDLGNPPDQARARELAEALSLEIQYLANDKSGESWSTDTYNLGLIDLDDIAYHKHAVDNQLKYSFGEYQDHEVLVNHKADYTLVFILHQPRSHFGAYTVLHFVLLIGILMLFYHATRRIFSPINTIKSGVQRFGEGDLDYRLSVNRKDELGQLAKHINTMADDIQSMLDAKRQLLLAISHELRSPLTRAKVATAMLDEKKLQENINRDLQEMEKLIDEILETERLSTRHYKLNKTDFDISATMREIIAAYDSPPLQAQLPTTPVMLNADPPRIKLLLRNVIDNAVRHTPQGAEPVSLQVEEHNQQLTITVIDHGEGIAEEHLPHITEPFYRVDPSRQRETGGYGLGLYLCKVICEAHKGTLAINSVRHQGTTIEIKLPLAK